MPPTTPAAGSRTVLELVRALVDALGLDGSGRLLDVGCGPGSLTLLLAPWFAGSTGLDADAGMLAEAARQAELAGVTNVDWVQARAEELPPALGPFRCVTLAQAFHWMDRPTVARLLHDELAPGGVLVHVHAETHQGIDSSEALPHPGPPWRQVNALVREFLGLQRRAGKGTRPEPAFDQPVRGRIEEPIYRGAGFTGPTRYDVPGATVVRDVDDLVAAVFSLSYSSPHLFGGRLDEFEAALRELLVSASDDGVFSERLRETTVDLWRPDPSHRGVPQAPDPAATSEPVVGSVGAPSRKPWTASQPSARTIACCSSVSMPSAMTRRPIAVGQVDDGGEHVPCLVTTRGRRRRTGRA